MTETAAETRLRWYQGIPRYAWLVLIIAALGWLFDTMDQNIFNLVRQPSVKDLLDEHVPPGELDATAKIVGGQITAIFLIGWAIGGFLFGILGDKLGRTRTMIITILIYAVFTGFSGLVQTPWQYALCRFLTALGVGGEFAAGAALVAEVWPNRSRPMALGTLQALSAIGNMMAGAINIFLASLSWRYAFFVGAAPALLVLWIRRSVKEPEAWQHAEQEAHEGSARKELGNIFELFRDPVLRRNTIAGVLMAVAGVGGAWGVAFFMPDLNMSALKPLVAGLPKTEGDAQIKSWIGQIFIIQNIGAFLGMFGYAALSERIGRRPALGLFLILAFGSVEATFWGVRDLTSAQILAFTMGFCAFALFSAYCVIFPELFPTRLRATGVGFCYNCARILAAFAPVALGGLSAHFASPTDETAGLRTAAAIVASIYFVGFAGLFMAPETRGKPLPE